MCGIAGILRVYPPGVAAPPHFESIPEAWLDLLDDSIKHRGPDGQGRFRDRAIRADGCTVDVALIHRRLSILDHKGGAQPMVSASRSPSGLSPSAGPEGVASIRRPQDRAGGGAVRADTSTTFPLFFQGSPTAAVRYEPIAGNTNNLLAVTFNGCIYNHRELRKELEAKGHLFVTDHSDTEVLLHGWREWRFDLLKRLEGMYAVAMWDRVESSIVHLRDRFGEKPLEVANLYDESGQELHAWGSSYAGLTQLIAQLDPQQTRSNPDVQVGWIEFGWNCYSPARFSRSIGPGSGSFVGPNYFASMRHARVLQNPITHTPHVQSVDAQLRQSVHQRLEADVPLGVFLSGGIDSGLIAQYASERQPNLRAFTVRMPHPDFDESQAAALTARTLGIRHEILDCQPDAASDLVHAIEQLGLPFGDSSLLPTLWLCRAAKPHVSVALSGDGGDELFLGYERQRVAPLLSLAAYLNTECLDPVAEALELNATPNSRRSKLARLCRAATGAYGDLVAIFPRHLSYDLMGDNRYSYFTPWEVSRHVRPALPEADRNFDINYYLPFDLLRKSDTASMSVALELRSPMLDSTVARLAINASRRSLMPRGQRKGLLRAVARKYLPKEVVDRPKMGFAIPVGEWFRSDFGQMRTLLLDMLHSADPFPPDLLGLELNRRFIDQMLAEHMESRRDHSQRLYMLLVLAIWCRWLRRIRGDARGVSSSGS